MKSRRLSGNRSSADKGDGGETAVNQQSEEVALGDIIWVSLHGSSWWPAQVVDVDTVSQNNKPRTRAVGEVLVRLYGSYKYMYVDPMTCRAEFENILKRNNGNHSEIFQKALEQDLAGFKSGRAKGKGIKSEGKVRVGSPQDKISKQTIIEKCQEIESPISTRGAVGNHPIVSVQGTIMLKTGLDAKTSGGNASAKDATEQHSLKSQTSRHQARVSRRILVAHTMHPKVDNSNSLSDKAEEARRTKRKEAEMRRKVEPHSPKSKARISSRSTAGGTLQTMVKDGNSLPAKTEETKSKKQKHNLVQKKLKSSSPCSAATLAGKSQELTARRMKVMRGLGLIAPSGSPFHRNGHICPNLSLCS